MDYRTITDVRTDDGLVKLLYLLEDDYRPTHKRMGPLRRLPADIPVPTVHIPRWKWTLPAADGVDVDGAVTLDAAAAYVSAASSVRVGLNRLDRGVQAPEGKPLYPGWYLIDYHHWQERALVSPLGTGHHAGQLWVAHPTLQLLRQLEERGVWPDTTVYDCWTSSVGVRLTEWTDLLKQLRGAIMDADDRETYEAFKDGYAQAIQLMVKGVKCETRRPDWTHAIWAQHSAFTTWWKAWRALECGHPPIAMKHPDEMTFTADAYAALQSMQDRPLKERPLTLDPTGRTLGSYRIKTKTEDQAVIEDVAEASA